MIFGGLEIVAGGYLIHRHYSKKCKKEQLEEEAQWLEHTSASSPSTPSTARDTTAEIRVLCPRSSSCAASPSAIPTATWTSKPVPATTTRPHPHAELQHPPAACPRAQTPDHHTTLPPARRLLRNDIAHAYRQRLAASRAAEPRLIT
jgi:hypothetical protein